MEFQYRTTVLDHVFPSTIFQYSKTSHQINLLAAPKEEGEEEVEEEEEEEGEKQEGEEEDML